MDESSVVKTSPELSRNKSRKQQEASIAWQNVTIEVRDWTRMGERKIIVNNVNGHFNFHTLNGIMGTSGAGKTTLLNSLTGSSSNAWPSSVLFIGGRESSKTFYFIPQHVEETIHATMTVSDILLYAFWFKNGVTHQRKTINEHMVTVMKELLLDPLVLDRPFHQCSGGEKKRIAIAQELMSILKPAFLFVDEPTTGLDSNAAYTVMKCLKSLAENHRMTVIVSIHVPNHETLCLFDNLYVMAKGGVCVYSGSPNQIEAVLSKELDIELTDQQQPIEELIKIACKGVKHKDTILLANKCSITQLSELSARAHHMHRLAHFGLPTHPKFFSPIDLILQMRRTFNILFISGFKSFFTIFCGIFMMQLFIVSIFGTQMTRPNGCDALPFDELPANKMSQNESALSSIDNEFGDWHRCQRDLSSRPLVYENLNYFAISSNIQQFICAFLTYSIFTPLMNVFKSEYRNRWYSLYVFIISSAVFTFVELFVCQLFYSVVTYFLSEQHYADNYEINWLRLGHFVLALQLLLLMSVGSGLIVSVLASHPILAAVGIAVQNNFFAMLNDFYFKTDQTFEYIKIASNLIGVKYYTRYLIYIFYGLDRCNPETEFSFIVDEFNFENSDVEFFIRVLVRNGIILLITFCVISLFRFHSFVWLRGWMKIFSRSKNLSESTTIRIDNVPAFDRKRNLSKKSLSYSVNMFEMFEEENEQFNAFTKDRLIIGWKNVSLLYTPSIYTHQEVRTSKQPRVILNNISGSFQFGSLNALMGVSGAGKTSLLRVLNGQLKDRLSQESEFYLSKFAHVRTSYLTQDVSSHLWIGLTVKQSLLYAAKLRNCQLNTKEAIDYEQIAQSLIEELKMQDIAHNQVQNCSGGERKRLALAQELTAIRMPNLVCVDEPTSGLDSNSSEVIISYLRFLAKKRNICIITSIHQPSMDIMSKFDKLYVLARGGHTVFSGTPAHLVSHLNSMPFAQFAGGVEYKTAIEELIKHSCHSERGDPTEIIDALRLTNSKLFNESEAPQFIADVEMCAKGIPTQQNRFSLVSVGFLLERYLRLLINFNWMIVGGHFIIGVAFAFFLSKTFPSELIYATGCYNLNEYDFNNTCSKTDEVRKKEEYERASYMFMFICLNMILIYTITINVISLFLEHFIFFNEHRNGWYSSGAFYLAKTINDAVLIVPFVVGFLYVINIYSEVLPDVFGPLLFICYASVFYIQGLCQVFVWISSRKFVNVILYSSFFMTNLFMFNNIVVKIDRLHYFYQMLTYFSISRFNTQACFLLLFGFDRCEKGEIQLMMKYLGLTDNDYYVAIKMIIFNVIFAHSMAFYLQLRITKSEDKQQNRTQRILEHLKSIRSDNCQTPISNKTTTITSMPDGAATISMVNLGHRSHQ